MVESLFGGLLQNISATIIVPGQWRHYDPERIFAYKFTVKESKLYRIAEPFSIKCLPKDRLIEKNWYKERYGEFFMTEKLYLDNQYLQEFSSAVAQNIDAGEKWGVILEQTLFYPASGGQPHDTGTLNGIPVIDVIEDSKQGIIHLCGSDTERRKCGFKH
jgi:hypothetical protein